MSLRRALYSALLYLIAPLVLLRLLWRSRTNPAYRHRIMERFGFSQLLVEKPTLWVHAVSVGETIAAKPLIEALISTYPDHKVLVTTTTPTGSAQVNTLFSDRVAHVYFPYDLIDVVNRFLKRIKPKILIIVETEIWPNLYAACGKNNIKLIMINARLSPKSTNSYQKIKPLIAETLAYVDLIAVRSEIDLKNFKKIGAIESKIKVYGNIKFDNQPSKKHLITGQLRRKQWGERRLVWLAASTHKGEDEQILDIHLMLLQQFPNLLLIIVPRHPERFNDVYDLYSQNQSISVIRHSRQSDYYGVTANVVLGDSMGEMQSWFACSDGAFIGGSLVKTGGHNPLEAIAQSVPVASGKHMFNFEDIVSELLKEELLDICETSDQLATVMAGYLSKKKGNLEIGGFKKKAKAFMKIHQGVTPKLVGAIQGLLKKP